MKKLEDIIRKHVLKNAYDYGKADAGAVVGKVIAEFPDAKKDMKKTMGLINAVINEVGTLSKEAIKKGMKKYKYAEKKEEKKELELPGAIKGKVVTRFPPEPSGYPHIGHSKAAWLNYASAKRYAGDMILRFDDTNPEKESEEYVDAIKKGLKWLGIKWKKETYTSDYIPKIYKLIEKLIQGNRAYVCICTQALISQRRKDGRACMCRNVVPEEKMKRWKDMLNGKYRQGKAIVRFVGDMKSLNTVMLDPTLARIIEAKHFRQGKKYRVWPSYDMAVVVVDHLEGITHPMRSKEYELRNELYYALFDALGFKKPNLIEFSRLAIKNAPVSKRLITPLVKEGKVLGWDDPRLPTLEGLKRRGILPEAIKTFVLSPGLSKSESEPDWELLLSENRKLLDPVSNHYFFVRNPAPLVVKNLRRKVKLPLHPKKKKGFREFEVDENLYISADDAKDLKKGDVFRLKDLCNVKLLKKYQNKLLGELAEDSMVPRKIQWIAGKWKSKCTVLVPHDLLDDRGIYDPESLEISEGYCEKGCEKLGNEEIIQFERFGFCRLDKKDKKGLQFVFSC
jgi:glutamyl-tRNA synthetase